MNKHLFTDEQMLTAFDVVCGMSYDELKDYDRHEDDPEWTAWDCIIYAVYNKVQEMFGIKTDDECADLCTAKECYLRIRR